jgi:hypothetical protein
VDNLRSIWGKRLNEVGSWPLAATLGKMNQPIVEILGKPGAVCSHMEILGIPGAVCSHTDI